MSLKRNLNPPMLVIFLAFFTCILIGLPRLIPNTNRGVNDFFGFSSTGVWNGFNDHNIVVECSNNTDHNISLSISLKNPSNDEIGTEDFSLIPHGTTHLLLNKFPIKNSYGIFILKGSTGESSDISCYTITYRMDLNGEVQYATSMSVGKSVTGRTGGVYNSMNPSSSTPVYNWLSVTNPGESDFSAGVTVRDQAGLELSAMNFRIEKLKPGHRTDIALGHPSGQVVGTYEINPDEPETAYEAFLSRYSEVSPGEYNFSMTILATKGYADSGIVPASTMGPAINWGEIANLSEVDTSVIIEIFNRAGETIHSEEKTIAPYSQYHVFLNQYIGELSVGYFRVRALNNENASLVVQSVYYGHEVDDSTNILWAYNSSATGGDFANTASYPVNTNLNAPNWLKVFSEDSSSPITLLLELHDSTGNLVPLGEKAKLSFLGSSDYPIHELVGPDFVGNLKISSENGLQNFQGQLIRVFSVGANARSSAMTARSMSEISGRKIGRTNSQSGVGTILAFSTSNAVVIGNGSSPTASPTTTTISISPSPIVTATTTNVQPSPSPTTTASATFTSAQPSPSPETPAEICREENLEVCLFNQDVNNGQFQSYCCYDRATQYCDGNEGGGCFELAQCIFPSQQDCGGYCCPANQTCGDVAQRECISGCRNGESACPTDDLCCASDEICVQRTTAPLESYLCEKRVRESRCTAPEFYCGAEGGQATPQDPDPGFCCPEHTTCNMEIDGTASGCCPVGTNPIFDPASGRNQCFGSVQCVHLPTLTNYDCPTGTACCESGCCIIDPRVNPRNCPQVPCSEGYYCNLDSGEGVCTPYCTAANNHYCGIVNGVAICRLNCSEPSMTPSISQSPPVSCGSGSYYSNGVCTPYCTAANNHFCGIINGVAVCRLNCLE